MRNWQILVSYVVILLLARIFTTGMITIVIAIGLLPFLIIGLIITWYTNRVSKNEDEFFADLNAVLGGQQSRFNIPITELPPHKNDVPSRQLSGFFLGRNFMVVKKYRVAYGRKSAVVEDIECSVDASDTAQEDVSVVPLHFIENNLLFNMSYRPHGWVKVENMRIRSNNIETATNFIKAHKIEFERLWVAADSFYLSNKRACAIMKQISKHDPTKVKYVIEILATIAK